MGHNNLRTNIEADNDDYVTTQKQQTPHIGKESGLMSHYLYYFTKKNLVQKYNHIF